MRGPSVGREAQGGGNKGVRDIDTLNAATHAVPADQLRSRCDPKALGFATTDELEPSTSMVGQTRALEAIKFGTNIGDPGFNLFVLGPTGAGKTYAVRTLLEPKAAGEEPPCDWVYVNNFDKPYQPVAIPLPRMRAQRLSKAMVQVIDELRSGIPGIFEAEEYQRRRRAIDEQFRAAQEEALEDLNKKAEAQDIAVLKTPAGFAMAPAPDGKVLKPEAFHELPKKERMEIEKKIESLQGEMQAVLQQMPRLAKEARDAVRELNEEHAEVAVRQVLTDVQQEFTDVKQVQDYLKAAEQDLIRNIGLFVADVGEQQQQQLVSQSVDSSRDVRFRRYMVNILVSADSDEGSGAPIIEEDNPTLGNLIGRIEHIPQMGALITDFLLIKPGALHRANGGYLLLDARKMLLAPYAWEALKRSLKSQEISIESPTEQLGMISTVTLQPERIPLNVKVVLFGDPMLYYLLSAQDPDFPQLFKVAADFDDTMDRTSDSSESYAGLVASIAQGHDLKPVDAEGVARLIDEGARLAQDSQKLTLRIEALSDILREANYWAGEAKHAVIGEADVSRAIEERIRRSDRLREKTQESIERGIVLVSTEGTSVGQINGLSVQALGNFAYGRPNRITARVRTGSGRLVDIEREVALGGPLHSKGVMILRGFLEGRYVDEVPMALSASLVFEQSYGGVDGDSASSAELYALLSALAEAPIKQSLAVTGSVNQHGQVQAIGGVNEKIEGFYDICKARGLTGEQGVIIPESNVVHLMLRPDVVEAVKKGSFTIYAVETIDQGIEILTGIPAGERQDDGEFPEGSINRLVEERLMGFAISRREFGVGAGDRAAPEEEIL
jgi:lon-related putative ATP-dependent protease